MKLIEGNFFRGYEVTEDTTGSSLKVRGIFGRADAKNENGRVYPKSVWEKVLREGSDPMRRLNERNMFGELDHPDDGKTLLSRASHIVTGLNMESNGTITGSAEILPTPSGKILEALFRAGTLVGISSRGEGDLTKTQEGTDVVQDGYALETFDFVHNPSTAGAYPKPTLESKGVTKMGDALRTYRELEESVIELSRVKVGDLPPALRSVVEKQAQDTLTRLSRQISEGGEHSALFNGLLTEFQGVRRNLIRRPASMFIPSMTEEDVLPTDPKADGPSLEDLKADTKSETKTEESAEDGSVENGVDVDSIPLIPGSKPFHKLVGESDDDNDDDEEENDMAEARNSRLQSLLREAEEATAALTLSERKANSHKLAQRVAEKCESRIMRKTMGLIGEASDLMPKAYDAIDEPSGEADLPDGVKVYNEMAGDEDFMDDEMPMEMDDEFGDDEEMPMEMDMDYGDEGDDEVDIPEPPMEMYNEMDDEEEDEDMPPMEAKLVRAVRKLRNECKRLQYERTVTEAVAAKSVAKLSRRIRIAEGRAAYVARRGRGRKIIEANGQRIPVRMAGEVIESLVEKYKQLENNCAGSSTFTESVGDFGGPFDSDANFDTAPNVSTLNENLTRTRTNKKSGSLLENQAALGAAVASRIGRF